MVVQWVQTISITTKDGIPNFIVDKDRKVNTIKIFWSKIYFSECHDYMNAVIYYNPYYPTHIFATICLWVICKYSLIRPRRTQTVVRGSGPSLTRFLVGVFIGSTYHAYTLHVDYRNFINGVDQTAESVYTKLSSKFTVSRMKKKPATNSKPSKPLVLIITLFHSYIYRICLLVRNETKETKTNHSKNKFVTWRRFRRTT